MVGPWHDRAGHGGKNGIGADESEALMGVERQEHEKEEEADQSVIGRHLEDFVVNELGLGCGRIERFFPEEAPIEV